MGCLGGADACFSCRRGRESRRTKSDPEQGGASAGSPAQRVTGAATAGNGRTTFEAPDVRRVPLAAAAQDSQKAELLVSFRPLAAIAAGCPKIGP